jgi:hypothetical protein
MELNTEIGKIVGRPQFWHKFKDIKFELQNELAIGYSILEHREA